MKATEIQELIDFIAKSGLEEVNIETEGFKLSIKKSNVIRNETVALQPAVTQMPIATAPILTQPIIHSTPAQVIADNQPIITEKIQPTDKNLVAIKSPMIGTFYRSANPDTPVFVNVGDEIKTGKVVCIIEAMKLFNEIESEISGRIVKVLVDNATPVEYDQPLFLVEPN